MKMFYGNVPVNSMKMKHYEMDTNSATVQPSDLQSGVTCYGRGKKITGTGKAFEFAMYGDWKTNLSSPVPSTINVIQVGSLEYSVRMTTSIGKMALLDFANSQKIAEVVVNEVIYPITVSVQNGMLNVSCDETINIQLFYGRDRYI